MQLLETKQKIENRSQFNLTFTFPFAIPNYQYLTPNVIQISIASTSPYIYIYSPQSQYNINNQPIATSISEMKKRKLDINQIKKITLRGRQNRTITTKYQTVLSYFKQKDSKINKIFTVYLDALITDLLDQLSNCEIVYKLENQLIGDIHPVQVQGSGQAGLPVQAQGQPEPDPKNKQKQCLKFDTSCLKYICKEFPIRDIVDCLQIRREGSKKVCVQVMGNRLMNFFKYLRSIFPQFCSSVGEKVVIDQHQLKGFYQTFKCEWNKLHEKGRMEACEKIEKLLCRSLFFFGALIQNNIFTQIQAEQRLKRQQAADIGTKSQKKPTFKGITHQVSSTYSFGGQVDLMSHHHFSSCLMSQKSNQQTFNKTGYSQKSQRLVRRQRDCRLWDRAEIQNLKVNLKLCQTEQKQAQSSRFQIDLLSNDVENILIQQAFKIQKFKDESDRYRYVYPYYPSFYPSSPHSSHSNSNSNSHMQQTQTPFLYTQILASQQNRQQYLGNYINGNGNINSNYAINANNNANFNGNMNGSVNYGGNFNVPTNTNYSFNGNGYFNTSNNAVNSNPNINTNPNINGNYSNYGNYNYNYNGYVNEDLGLGLGFANDSRNKGKNANLVEIRKTHSRLEGHKYT